MIHDGVELCRVFEREAPDGGVYLVGMLGDAGIAIVKDPTRTGAWRVIMSDPSRANNRNSEPARAIAAPVDGWYQSEMNDDISDELLASQQEGDFDGDRSE